MQTIEETIHEMRSLKRYGAIKSITRLGGLTNRVFRVETTSGVFCLRLPGEGTEEYIDRGHECVAAKEAARVEVSAPVEFFDIRTGVSLTRFMEEVVTMTPQLFQSRQGAIARAGKALRQLHTSDAQFASHFDMFKMLDGYTKILAQKSAKVPAGYDAILEILEKARAALEAFPVDLAPCHCDPLCENFLDTGDRMIIVDWEYSGMNDPMWDIADLIIEAELGPKAEKELLHAYFNGEPSPVELGRIVIFKALCDLLWSLWGLIQHANRNPADDFWAYGNKRFQRCRELMMSDSFLEHVRTVQEGAEEFM
ncbi:MULTISPECIES: choline kinase family protein [Pseudomonas]|uniref:choline kinase family protein n=1 Tax=Pseudomonas TaxID=286 RepID=UPI001EE8D26B|nr:choline kinase family protein [Pseudomonas putida]